MTAVLTRQRGIRRRLSHVPVSSRPEEPPGLRDQRGIARVLDRLHTVDARGHRRILQVKVILQLELDVAGSGEERTVGDLDMRGDPLEEFLVGTFRYAIGRPGFPVRVRFARRRPVRYPYFVVLLDGPPLAAFPACFRRTFSLTTRPS